MLDTSDEVTSPPQSSSFSSSVIFSPSPQRSSSSDTELFDWEGLVVDEGFDEVGLEFEAGLLLEDTDELSISSSNSFAILLLVGLLLLEEEIPLLELLLTGLLFAGLLLLVGLLLSDIVELVVPEVSEETIELSESFFFHH